MEHDQSAADQAKQQAKAPDDGKRRRDSVINSAMQPASGAAVQHAAAGAALAGDGRALNSGETADALKRAAENDNRP